MKKQHLQQLFDAGQAPTPDQLLGPGRLPCDWKVTMETGPIPNVPTWRKRMWLAQGTVRGENIIGPFHWGRFFTYETFSGELVLDYLVASNDRFTCRIHDLMRTTDDPNVLLGKFYYINRHGKLRGGWFFKLTRIVR